MLLVLATGVANRVLYRLALVPMADHIWALAQLQTFGYVLVYGSILLWRVRSGVVAAGALSSVPKAPFLAIGASEASSSVSDRPLPLAALLHSTFFNCCRHAQRPLCTLDAG